MSRPSIDAMLAFVRKKKHGRDTDGKVLRDPFYRKVLARWADSTRVVINKDAPDKAKTHLKSFLDLYKAEKVIGVSEGTVQAESEKMSLYDRIVTEDKDVMRVGARVRFPSEKYGTFAHGLWEVDSLGGPGGKVILYRVGKRGKTLAGSANLAGMDKARFKKIAVLDKEST